MATVNQPMGKIRVKHLGFISSQVWNNNKIYDCSFHQFHTCSCCFHHIDFAIHNCHAFCQTATWHTSASESGPRPPLAEADLGPGGWSTAFFPKKWCDVDGVEWHNQTKLTETYCVISRLLASFTVWVEKNDSTLPNLAEFWQNLGRSGPHFIQKRTCHSWCRYG